MAKGSRQKTQSIELNQATLDDYTVRLREIAISCFEYNNAPASWNTRVLETALFDRGMAAIFWDDAIGGLLTLPCSPAGNYDAYGNPTEVQIESPYNGFHLRLPASECVIVYNNFTRTPSFPTINLYSIRLTEAQRTIDVNIGAQKTPIFVQGLSDKLLTSKNIATQILGNERVIFVDQKYSLENIKAINAMPEFVSDRIEPLKQGIWQEALQYLGVTGPTIQKRERVNAGETAASVGGVTIQRFVRLAPREEAIQEVNEKFGNWLDKEIEVKFRELDWDDTLLGRGYYGQVYGNNSRPDEGELDVSTD